MANHSKSLERPDASFPHEGGGRLLSTADLAKLSSLGRALVLSAVPPGVVTCTECAEGHLTVRIPWEVLSAELRGAVLRVGFRMVCRRNERGHVVPGDWEWLLWSGCKDWRWPCAERARVRRRRGVP